LIAKQKGSEERGKEIVKIKQNSEKLNKKVLNEKAVKNSKI
jgi:hypothetical protein